MAIQVKVDELDHCATYLEWLVSKTGHIYWEVKSGNDISGEKNSADLKLSADKTADLTPFGGLCKELFSVDFYAVDGIPEDDIRATDAMELRRRFAEEVGELANKSKRDIDRIWKSIRGKCSVLEFILQLAYRLDSIVNEDEAEAMVPQFFAILLGNLDVKETDSPEILKEKVDRFLSRSYHSDGSGGGLFPLKKYVEGTTKNQKELPVWDQMGDWISEHLDEDAYFKMDDFGSKTGQNR